LSTSTLQRLTASVTRLGWEGRFTLERDSLKAKKTLKKRGAYPKSGARLVGRRFAF
jgi:hypothetical protein